MALLDRFVEARPENAADARTKAKNAQFAARVVAAFAVALLILSLVPPAQTTGLDWIVPFLALGFLWTALHVRALDHRQSYWDLQGR